MSKSKRGTRFVPKVVFRTAFAGVVPVCVAGVACGGSQATPEDGGAQTTQGGSSSGTSSTFFGVAVSCFGPPTCVVSSTGSSTSSNVFSVAAFSFTSTRSATSTGAPADAAADHSLLTGDADATDDAPVPDSGDSG
jgi:hypothetical protein